ncbi:hypothetical protein BRADI_4g38048v3 [Brachypodium distachyon]|uniref:Uncharacterized protein n=1 Tax=Brachypodium distachyon TaxID=15368 RepID=A0A0Q3IZG4_BRADI|nr:hypothetical protein BRADI_4g38048v3 [Brachypodium distachyon]
MYEQQAVSIIVQLHSSKLKATELMEEGRRKSKHVALGNKDGRASKKGSICSGSGVESSSTVRMAG